MSIKLVIDKTDLSSRKSAAKLRSIIEDILNVNQKVDIDLSKVICMSYAYADELYGILALDYGLKEFVRSISFHGASPLVLRRIAEAVKKRIENELNLFLK